MDDETKLKERIGQRWSTETKVSRPARTKWWESPLIREQINQNVSGKEGLKVFSEGLFKVAQARASGRCFRTGVSVGAGVGKKEMDLTRHGLVENFVLFELSDERIRLGQELAVKMGLNDHVTFRKDDAFTVVSSESVDFVHWNNSLHHMFDVHEAVSWSHRILREGGMFYMDDFVGPTRWQWSQESLDMVNRIRAALPEEYLLCPRSSEGEKKLLKRVERPDPARVARNDPSEAADSGRILEAIKMVFPQAEITLTGGLVYHLALSEILHNFDEADQHDRTLLALLMLIDELCTHIPRLDNHYATAIAFN